MKYGAVIFDLDGTLVDTIPIYKRAFFETLAAFGIRLTEPEFNRIYWENHRLSDVLARYGKADREPVIRQQRNDLYVRRLGGQAEWFADAMALQRTFDPSVPRAIVTDSWRSFVDAIDSRTGLSNFADTIITADDRPSDKPHPCGLLLAAERLGIAPEQCVYIGDQNFDMQAADNAGMANCLIIREHTPQAAKENASTMIVSLEQLITDVL